MSVKVREKVKGFGCQVAVHRPQWAADHHKEGPGKRP